MSRGSDRPVEAAGLRAALDLLTPPYAAAAGAHGVPLVDGVVDVPATRAPAVLVRLRVPLERRAVVVRRDGVPATPPAVFTAWSAAGSLLPLLVPDLPGGPDGQDGQDGQDTVGPLRLTVTVRVVDGPAAHDPSTALAAAAAGTDLAAAAAAGLVETVVVEGRLARTVYLLTAEKQRIAAVAREIAASRHVSLARSGALDRTGADHGVPRFAGEDDDAYRARLRMVTSWRLATPAGFEQALNGVPDGSADGGPNTGLPSAVGVDARFRIVDEVDRLAVAVRMVEVVPPGGAGGGWRRRFGELARAGLLLDLETPPAARLPDATRTRLLEVRQVLRANLDRAQPVTERRYLAAVVATSLARAVRVLETLTGSGALTLRSAMTEDVDPRLDLGLGVAVDPLDPARVDAAVAAARDAQQSAAAGIDPGLAGPPDVVGAVLGARVRDRADDPAARWLFAAAGLDATPLEDGSLHLTSLPSQGLVIEGPGVLEAGASASYTARIHGGGSGRNVLVDEAWARAAPNLAHGGSPPDALTPATLDALLEQIATGVPGIPEALRPLVGDGLVPAAADQFAARVREAYDADLLLGVVVDPHLRASRRTARRWPRPGRRLSPTSRRSPRPASTPCGCCRIRTAPTCSCSRPSRRCPAGRTGRASPRPPHTAGTSPRSPRRTRQRPGRRFSSGRPTPSVAGSPVAGSSGCRGSTRRRSTGRSARAGRGCAGRCAGLPRRWRSAAGSAAGRSSSAPGRASRSSCVSRTSGAARPTRTRSGSSCPTARSSTSTSTAT
ncbi:hypothetical protein [Candidatus Protofrankia datiscae]|uniref:Uncharacterized protein n=1 Tax=Candidatus Protofrankia datiscae TaxID=2716812 RepID=F8B1K2_9ACTN|nr:hypothetical protein [Candidatus Protofrankia datiscae]AEH10754.1 hypothetical protein FsymDg_3463 [Candidatus Protofrankia datiscae]